MIRIALDFDDTYTEAPDEFSAFISMMTDAGHDVRIVTSRRIDSRRGNGDVTAVCEGMGIEVIFCGHRPKSIVCAEREWIPDIWIDDRPETILCESFS